MSSSNPRNVPKWRRGKGGGQKWRGKKSKHALLQELFQSRVLCLAIVRFLFEGPDLVFEVFEVFLFAFTKVSLGSSVLGFAFL